jgi:hypothetical protein
VQNLRGQSARVALGHLAQLMLDVGRQPDSHVSVFDF